MEPPLVYKPRQSSAPRQSASPNKSPCSIDPQFPTAAARTMTLKKNALRQIFGSGRGLRHFPRFPRRSRFAPTQSQRQNALLAFGVCHSHLLLSVLPVTGAGGAFLPRQGLGVFRHAWASEKRSQTF